jgi:hypothetical protein
MLARNIFVVVMILTGCATLGAFQAAPSTPEQWEALAERARENSRPIIDVDLSHGASFTFEIAPSLPKFSFKVSTAQEGLDISVFRANITEPIQHLTGCDWSEWTPPESRREWLYPGAYWFHPDDLNFDGYQDIYTMIGSGSGGEWGCVWLYNPAAGKFDYSDKFSNLNSYELDPSTRTITATGGGGAGIWNIEKYRVEGNEPVLILSVYRDYDDKRNEVHCVVKRLHGSTLVTDIDQWDSTGDACGDASDHPDPATAEKQTVEQYQKACDGGIADGCTELGVWFEHATSGADWMRAVQYLEKGCDGGSAKGCTNLGYIYEHARVTSALYDSAKGLVEDKARAAQLYQKACDNGDPEGCRFAERLRRELGNAPAEPK